MPKTIRKVSAVDEVFQMIHAQIVSGELSPGHRFPPQEIMAEEYGVSRSTIREAINKLTVLGHLAAKPGVGTTVVDSSTSAYVSAIGQYMFLASDEVNQFMEARLYLEKAAVRLAVLKASDEDLEELENQINEQAQAVAGGDSGLFSSLDVRFHRSLIEVSKNKVLMKFLELIWDGLSQFIVEVTSLKSAMENAFHFHGQLLTHLKARNLAMAERTLVEHLKDVAANIERNLGQDIDLDGMFEMELAPEPRKRIKK